MPSRRLLAVVLLGTVLRLCTMPLGGMTDLTTWREWSQAASADVTNIYTADQGPSAPFAYPPLAAIEFAAVGAVYRATHPQFEASATFNVLIKMPGVIAECVLLALALTWGRRRWGAATAETLAMGLWLNPALWLAGSVLGYRDAEASAPALIAMLAAFGDVALASGVLCAVAILTKPQGVVFVSGVGARLWQRRTSAVVGAVTAIAVLALLWLPFLARTPLTDIRASFSTNFIGMASAQAANVWWLVSWWMEGAGTAHVGILTTGDLAEMGLPGMRALGYILAISAMGWGLSRGRRVSTIATGALLCAWMIHAYFTLSIEVHENHLVAAIPFLVLAASLRREVRALTATLSLVVTANLALFYGVGANGWRDSGGAAILVMPLAIVALVGLCARESLGLSRPLRWMAIIGGVAAAASCLIAGGPYSLEAIRRSTGIDATVLVALANVGAFAWHTRTLWQMIAADSASIDA